MSSCGCCLPLWYLRCSAGAVAACLDVVCCCMLPSISLVIFLTSFWFCEIACQHLCDIIMCSAPCVFWRSCVLDAVGRCPWRCCLHCGYDARSVRSISVSAQFVCPGAGACSAGVCYVCGEQITSVRVNLLHEIMMVGHILFVGVHGMHAVV